MCPLDNTVLWSATSSGLFSPAQVGGKGGDLTLWGHLLLSQERYGLRNTMIRLSMIPYHNDRHQLKLLEPILQQVDFILEETSSVTKNQLKKMDTRNW